MRIIISKAELSRVAGPVVKAAAKKNSARPIYEHVLFAAADGMLNLYAGDGIDFLRAAAKAEVTEEGQIAVHAADLMKRLETMPDGPLVIASESTAGTINAYSIRSQTSARKHTYPCLDGSDFPEEPALGDGLRCRVSAIKLRSLLDRVKHAASVGLGKFTDFIWLGSDGTRLTTIATDGHRLAYSYVEPLEPVPTMRADIASSSADRICSILGDTGEADIAIGERHISVSYDCFDCVASLGAQGIPPVDHAELGQDRERFEVSAAVLADALKAVKLATDDEGIVVQVTDAILSVTGSSPDRGTSRDEIQGIQFRDTKPLKVNAGYLKAMLDASSCERVSIAIDDGERADLRVLGSGFEGIIMPMRQ